MSALLVSAPAVAAQSVAGGVVGRIVDDSGRPLSEARVALAGPRLQGERTFGTDRTGTFRALDLPVGTYTIRIDRTGYESRVFGSVRVELGRVRTLGDIALAPVPFELPAVIVSADAPSIDPTGTTVGFGLEAREFEKLPVSRRDYQSIIALLPHANESFFGDGTAIGGSTGLENTFFVDGANVTDPVLGLGGTRLPTNFVRSVRIRTGGYGAEYGKALGGSVDAITYSGGDEFEFHAFGFYAGSALADSPNSGLRDLRADAFQLYDAGVRIGGPVARGRLWYSAAYSPRVRSLDREIPDQGIFEDRETIHAFAGKITWRPFEASDVEVSLFGDPSTRDAVEQVVPSLTAPAALEEPGPLLSTREDGGWTAILRLRQQVASRVSLQADVSHSRFSREIRPGYGADPVLPLYADFLSNSWDGGPGYAEETSAWRTAAKLSATLLLASHTTRIGVEYEDNGSDHSAVLDLIFRLDPALYERNRQATSAFHHNRVPAVYVQDSWQATPRLALNAGVRWSRQQLAGDDGKGTQTFPGEWQPRFGAVYQPGRIGTQRIFASLGRYYQQLPVYFSQLFYAPFELQYLWYSADPRVAGVEPDSALSLSSEASDFPEVRGLSAEHFDEFTMGYERSLGAGLAIGARFLRRELRSAFGYGVPPDRPQEVVIGNIGVGDLDFLPEPERSYTSLEITLRTGNEARLRGYVSYVLSRTHGNYTGLFASDQGVAAPNNNPSNKFAEQGPGSSGLLPNDRTHAIKLAASYRFDFGLTTGTYATFQSGTPLNDFGAGTLCSFCPVFLQPRGTAGRMPSLWDLNFSFAWDLPFGSRTGGRVVLDLLHVGSPKQETWRDQVRFLSRDAAGGQSNPNPGFGGALAYQPPMAARLGFVIGLGHGGAAAP